MRSHYCFLHFRWRGKVYQFRTLPFGPSTAPKTFTRVTKPILHQYQRMGTTVFLYLDDALVLANFKLRPRTLGSTLTTETWFCAESGRVPAGANSRIYTSWSGVQHTEYDFVTASGQGPSDKDSDSQVASSLTCRAVIRLLSLINFAGMVLPLARLHPYLLQFWLKGTYRTPADLFKGLKPNSEAIQALYCWCTFNPKSLWRPFVEEVVITDASKKGYGATWTTYHSEAVGLQRRAETLTSTSWKWKQCGIPVKHSKKQWGGRPFPSRNTNKSSSLSVEGGRDSM